MFVPMWNSSEQATIRGKRGQSTGPSWLTASIAPITTGRTDAVREKGRAAWNQTPSRVRF